MKKAAIYIRVSTQEQAREGYSIAAQKERLINFCKAKNWNIYNIYIDGGFSGSNLERPAMQKMLNNLHGIDIVLVFKLDRLSRSQQDTLYLIAEQFLKNEVDFVSLSESFDTSTPFGRAMIGILSVFAQLERETITERTKIGRKERAKEGLFHGGGFTPIGYDYIDSNLVINEYEAIQVREIFKLYLEGKGTLKISEILDKNNYTHKHGSWTTGLTTSIRKILQNPLYIGKISFESGVYDAKHEPIIDTNTFEDVQKIIERRQKTYKSTLESNHLLIGLIYCGNCGARYMVNQIHSRGHKYKYYSCHSRRKIKPTMVKDPNCKNPNWRMEELDKYVVDQIRSIAVDKNILRKLYDEVAATNEDNNNETFHKKIKDLDKQIDKLMDLYQYDKLPAETISKRIEKLYIEKKELQNKIVEVKKEEKTISYQEVEQLIDNFQAIWDYAGINQKRQILNGLIDKIVIYKDRIEIIWSFI